MCRYQQTHRCKKEMFDWLSLRCDAGASRKVRKRSESGEDPSLNQCLISTDVCLRYMGLRLLNKWWGIIPSGRSLSNRLQPIFLRPRKRTKCWKQRRRSCSIGLRSARSWGVGVFATIPWEFPVGVHLAPYCRTSTKGIWSVTETSGTRTRTSGR